MTAPTPATIQNAIIQQINVRLVSGVPIRAEDTFWLNGLKRDAKKLMEIDPASAHIALAAIAHFEWNEEASRYHLRCAGNIRNDSFIVSQQLVVLANFGYFSEASELIEEALSPENGFFIQNYNVMYTIGAFQKLADFNRKAKGMGLDLSGLPTDLVEKASKILRDAGVSDERAAAALDVAGRLLNQRKLISAGDTELSVDEDGGHLPTVFITFPLCVTADVASEMTFEFYENLLSKFSDHSPSLNIGFRSKRQQ